MESSAKFKWLFEHSQSADFTVHIPPLTKIYLNRSLKDCRPPFNGIKPYILRSSLKGESGPKMNSGKSISVPLIKTREDFDRALSIISMQDDLEHIVLQEQANYEKHYTAILTDGLIYVEPTSQTESHENLFHTKHTIVGTIQHSQVLEVLKKIERVNKSYLVEIGATEDQVFIFQVVEMNSPMLEALSNHLVDKIFALRRKCGNRGFLGHLNMEFQAWNLRRKFFSKSLPMNLKSSFDNWISIFHYFNIYLMIHKKKYDGQSWTSFLNWIQGGNYWLSLAVKEHIRVANALAHSNGNPHLARFTNDQEPHFLGEGRHRVVVGKNAIIMDTLAPKSIYELPQGATILTIDNHILSHGFLAAVERGLKVVANLPREMVMGFRTGQNLQIDFKTREISI